MFASLRNVGLGLAMLLSPLSEDGSGVSDGVRSGGLGQPAGAGRVPIAAPLRSVAHDDGQKPDPAARAVAAPEAPPLRHRGPMWALKRVFLEEGVPGELVWIAEVESSLNPSARSRAGALGLFQLMPDTAHRFGLRTGGSDERLSPEKSARAAARYLKELYGEFRSWPLAIAAYNAGRGCVGRLLRDEEVDTFAAVFHALPHETQSYVPRVLALVADREGISPQDLPAPSSLGG